MIMANSGSLVNPSAAASSSSSSSSSSTSSSSYSNGTAANTNQATANVAQTNSNATASTTVIAGTQQISSNTTPISSTQNHRTQAPPPPLSSQPNSSSTSSTATTTTAAVAVAQTTMTSNTNTKTPSPTPPTNTIASSAPTTTTAASNSAASSNVPAASVSTAVTASAASTTTTTTTAAVTSAPAATTSNQPPRTAILSNDQRWIFSIEKILSSPSRQDNMSPEEEANERLKAALFIHELGSKIKVNQLCVNTAMIYMHRFFMIHSFKKFHPNVRIVATACLFFACKVEEQPRRLREFIDAVHAINRKPHDLATHNSEEYRRYGDEIVILESCILQTLGFNVLVNHAHTVIIKTCQMIKAPRDLAEAAYLTATNSLIISNFCVKFSSEKVACFCIYLACKWTGLKIPTSSEGMQWYQYVNSNINEQELEEITKEYLAIYEQVPEKVKRKLGKTKTNDEVDNQQQQQQQLSHKPKPVDLNKTAPSALQTAQKHHPSQNPNSIHGQNQPSGPPVMKKHPNSNSTSSLSVSNQISSSSSSMSSSSSSSTNTLVNSHPNKMNYNSHSNNHYQHPPGQQHLQQHNSQVKQSVNQPQAHMKPGPNMGGQPHNIAYSGANQANKNNQQQQQQQQHRSNSNHHLSFNGADESEPKAKMSQYSNSMSNLNSMTANKKPQQQTPLGNAHSSTPSSSPFLPAANGSNGGALKLPGAPQAQQSPVKSSLNTSSMKRGNEELNSMSSVPNKMPKYINDAPKTTS